MKKLLLIIPAVLAMISCAHQNPFFGEWTDNYGIPPFDKIENSDYLPAVEEGIAQHQAEVQAIIDNPEEPSFENVIVAYDRSGAFLSKVLGVLFNVSETDGSDELNAIVEDATKLISDHYSALNMNAELFAKVKAVYDGDQSGYTREQQMVLKEIYEGFVKNGVGLDEVSQKRLREINSELSTLTLTFGNHLLAESNAYKAEIGSSVSNYYDEMATVSDRELREKMFRLYSMRGNNGNENDNKETILRTMALRIEKAKLLGFDTPAQWILSDKMAGDPQTVDTFLSGIMDAAMARAKAEVVDMQEFMDKDIEAGLLPAGTKIQPWDYMYYAEKVRRARYALDENEAMQYFKAENVRGGIFALAGRLYGLSFEPIENVGLFNPEAEAFKVTDSDGSFIGVLITDYYSRETKRAGAWMNNVRDQYVDVDGTQVRPIIVNICNFNAPTAEQPSLLTIDQVQTAFHEFGHALHGLLSQCTYRTVSGTAVKRDFVELPSQINENWAFEKEVLATYAFNWKTGELIPDELVEKIQAAAKFNQGFTTGELCAASILDMKWHELGSVEGVDVEAFEKKCCEEMGLIGEIIPRYRSTYFNHIFGGSGYSAGYYSYLWAEVLDKDAFELFRERGVFDKETAMSFRHNILEMGGSEEPMTLYRRFRGADPDAGALLRARGL